MSLACVSYTEKPIPILSLNLALPPSALAPASLEHEDMSRLLGMLITLNYLAHLFFLFISVGLGFVGVILHQSLRVRGGRGRPFVYSLIELIAKIIHIGL